MPTVKAPGKLYIAGEYAVVEPGQPAILIAVDQFVYATISQAKQGLVSSKQLLGQDISWTRKTINCKRPKRPQNLPMSSKPSN